MNCDLHLHTHFSCDSSERFAAYCERAMAIGVDCLCFTDHFDNNPLDDGYGYYRAEDCLAEFLEAKKQYGGRLKLLFGVEFGEPHLFPEEMRRLSRLPYDFILCSIHSWIDGLFASEVVRRGIAPQESYEAYWRELERAVDAGGFDALAHPDFPKRYCGVLHYDRQQMLRIFSNMAQKGMALEVNTSPLRKGMDCTLPGDELLLLYREAGGQYITLGTDAHRAEDLFCDLPRQKERIAALGLTEVYYEGRQRRELLLR